MKIMKSKKLSSKTNIYKKLRQIYFCFLYIPVTAFLLSAGFTYLLNIAFIHQPSIIPYLMSFQSFQTDDVKANELIYFVNNLEQFSVFMLGLALLWLLINSPVVAFFSINWFDNHLERNSANTDQTSIKNEKTTNTTNPDKDYFVANLVRLSIGLPRKK